jgi:nitrogen fixation protein FixH
VSPPASTPGPPGGPAPRSLWRNEIVWLLVAIVAMVVGGNAVMVWIALRAEPNLVQPDYYEASKRVDSEQAARAASGRLGWRVAPVAELRGPASIAVRVTDAEGRPVRGLAGTAAAYRPSDAGLDQTLRWSEDGAQAGLYRAEFARPASGFWRITLDLRREGERLYQDFSLVTP